jgi:uncharacterized protein (DUF433 family)
MTLTIEPETFPLTTLPDGTVRVGKTRVTLDTIVNSWLAGATPEAIVLSYPTVTLADVYAVIAYYLRHQLEVTPYLMWRASQAEEIQKEIEEQFNPKGIRERLLSRRAQQSKT